MLFTLIKQTLEISGNLDMGVIFWSLYSKIEDSLVRTKCFDKVEIKRTPEMVQNKMLVTFKTCKSLTWWFPVNLVYISFEGSKVPNDAKK